MAIAARLACVSAWVCLCAVTGAVVVIAPSAAPSVGLAGTRPVPTAGPLSAALGPRHEVTSTNPFDVQISHPTGVTVSTTVGLSSQFAPSAGSHTVVPAKTSGASPRASRIASYASTYAGGLAEADDAVAESLPNVAAAIGIKYYVEAVDSVVAVYDRGVKKVASATLATLVGEAAGTPVCEPQIEWDPTSGRWEYAALYCNNSDTQSQRFEFGYSMTSDPTNLSSGWCQYYVSTGSYRMDSPRLGHDNDFFVVASNAFDISSVNAPFISTAIWVFSKPAAGVTTCPLPQLWVFGTPNAPLHNSDGTMTFGAVPANTVNSASIDYVVAAETGNNNMSASSLMLWYLARTATGAPTLFSVGEQLTPPYQIAQNVPQPGGSVLTVGDGRLTEVIAETDPVFNRQALWTEQTVADPSASPRAVVRWYELVPGGAIAIQTGYVSDGTDSIFDGVFSPTIGGDRGALVYNRAGPSDFPAVGAVSWHSLATANAGNAELDPGEMVLGSSLNPDTDPTCPVCEWDIGATASPDPLVAGVVWGSNQVEALVGGWSTQNFAVRPAGAPGPPVGVTAVSTPGSVLVSWSPPLSDGGAPIDSYTVTPYVGANAQPQRVLRVAGVANGASIFGLTDGVGYTFSVVATNEAGTGPPATTSSPVLPDSHQNAAQSNAPAAAPTRVSGPQSNAASPGGRGANQSRPTDEAVAFQVDVGHSGSQPFDPARPPLVQKWSFNGPGQLSYPLVAAGRVFIVGSAGSGSNLYALDVTTGNLLWGPVAFTYQAAGFAYDNGRVFVVSGKNINSHGAVTAIDAATGSIVWGPVPLGNANIFESPPVAADGFVYVTGEVAAGTPGVALTVLSEATGAVSWTALLYGMTFGPGPVISPTGVYVEVQGDSAADFNPPNGAQLWSWQTGGSTTSSTLTPALYGGRLYLRDSANDVILDARTGRSLGTFPYGPAPAFDGNIAFFLNGATHMLQAIDSTTGNVLWSFTGDGSLVSAPIVVNGYVYIASSAGNVYAVNIATGTQAWTANAGFPVQDPNACIDCTGMTAAEGYVLVPASATLVVYGQA